MGPFLAKFQPQFLLVSAGYDAGAQEPLGNMMLSATGFSRISQFLIDQAEKLCGGRVAFFHEGGYNKCTVPFSALRVIENLSRIKTNLYDPLDEEIQLYEYHELQPHQEKVIQRIEADFQEGKYF